MKKVLLSFCLSLAGFLAMAQAGSLDNLFGNNGIATIQVGNSNDNARAVAIQADGKILVVGQSVGPVFNNNFSVCRLKTDGSLDDQFDGDGKVIIPVGDFGGMAMAVVIQPDGKILVGGRGFYNDDEDITVVRLMPNGSPDPNFGTNGIAHIGFNLFTDERFADMALQQDGKIVLTGVSFFSGIDGFFVARLNSDGIPDPGFGVSGKKIIQVNGSYWSEANSVAVQTDGKIVLGGISKNNTLTNIWNSSVVRLLPGGDPDPTFGTINGELTLVTNVWNQCNSVLLQPDGKILMAGVERNSSTQRDGFLIVRLTATGSLDDPFGVNGNGKLVLFQDVGGEATRARDMVLQPDGQIIVVGNLPLANGNAGAAIRLTSVGALDNSFGDEGIASLHTYEVWTVALQADGKIVMATGPFSSNLAIDFVVARLNGGNNCLDADNDGYDACSGDCNDNDPTVHPGATEICNGKDDDCDGQVDEGVTTTFYRDADNDGFGDANLSVQACSAPTGYVTDNTDCDDTKFLYLDSDGDGYGSGLPIACGVDNNTDCDDANINVHLSITYFRDADGDGFGDPNDPTTVCQLTIPAGYVDNNKDCDDTKKLYADNDLDGYGGGPTIPCGGVENNTDCNDNNPGVHPGVFDICNDLDDDCDGLTDEDSPKITIYVDSDNDGWGDASKSILSCIIPPGYVDRAGDCNDNNQNIHPTAPEICNGFDDDCDGMIDENVILTFYFDYDKDGFGVLSNQVQGCTAPPGYTEQAGDCNDNNDAIHPGATEICNGIDDNCNGEVDENVLTIYYRDNDQDGYGNFNVSILSCSPPAGYVANSGDCDDTDPNIKPGATEICNGKDDDCNGQIDEGVTVPTWYRDADGDGYGNPNSSLQSCSQPQGYVNNNSDCDDTNDTIHPNATEYCNGIDENCNGIIDDNPVLVTWYRDADEDGWGDPNQTVEACLPPSGYIREAFDCDDTDPNVHPEATEIDNGKDDNCDGQIDEDVLITYYRDADKDLFGDPSNSTQASTPPDGYVTNNTDCNDNNAAINPNAAEVCDGVDNNCNGQIDEGVKTTFYRDQDGDTYGDPNNTTLACTVPNGYVTNNSDCDDSNEDVNPTTIWYLDVDNDNYYTGSGITQCTSPGNGYKFSGLIEGGDCNDNDPNIHPGATEICNSIDDDCNGQVDDNAIIPTWYLDADNDNYYTGAGVTQCNTPGTGYKATGLLGGGDCNDGNAAIHPNATEVCNGVDDNCNGQIDEGVKTTFFRDADTDGFGDPNTTTLACTVPAGYVTNNTDCNDNNAAINPNTVWHLDSDNDNYYTGTGITQCTSPGAGYKFSGLIAGGDCNDGNASINPGATEVCNGVDDNCNGQVDEGVKTTFYRDFDGDGFGDPNNTTLACTVPAGYVTNNTDCNDNNAAINPNTIWHLDADNDNYYTGSGIIQCISPGSGYKMSGLTGGGDCNDGNASINPGATEVCGNNVDDNCNGQTDEGCPTVLSVSINDVTVYESQGQAVLTISLSKPATNIVKVNFKTIDGTASKKDYKNANGTVVIAAGSLTAQVTVSIIPDNINEGSEFFDVEISLPKIMGQSQTIPISDGLGRVTIFDGVAPAITKAITKNMTDEKSDRVIEGFKVSLAPNPSTSYFRLSIESNSVEPIDIRVFDVQGRLVKHTRNNPNYLRFGSELISGVYMVEVRQGKNKKTVKAIKL